jgi:hypothetical protein
MQATLGILALTNLTACFQKFITAWNVQGRRLLSLFVQQLSAQQTMESDMAGALAMDQCLQFVGQVFSEVLQL